MAGTPSSGAPRHLLPRGEKEQLGDVPSPSPLAGEGGSRGTRETDEGAAGNKLRFARKLRREMTEAEWKLWHALRDRRFEGYKFRRQVPIGKYIADFVCQECKLIVEVDGSQHANSTYDIERDAWLALRGYRVLRFWNVDIFQALDGTMMVILDALRAPPHPPLRGTFSREGRRQEKKS